MAERKKKYCHFCGMRLTEKFVEGKIRLFCEQCNEPLYENPTPATCLVVIDDKDRLLLVKRSVEPKIGFWCLPGGFIEMGETPDQGALRELEEETGLSGNIEMLLGVNTSLGNQNGRILMVGYLVKSFNGKLRAGDDATDAAYFTPVSLPEIAFESHKKFIQIYYSALSPQPLILPALGSAIL
ncbi:NUDIX hydrolase [Thermodesulfobacteriota bacterium]